MIRRRSDGKVKVPPYLLKRGNVFHYHRRIPAFARDACGGQSFWRASLATGDLFQAERLCRARAIEHDAFLANLRDRQRQTPIQRAYAALAAVQDGSSAAQALTALHDAIIAEGMKALPDAPPGLHARIKSEGGLRELVNGKQSDEIEAYFSDAAADMFEVASQNEDQEALAEEDRDNAAAMRNRSRRASDRAREKKAILSELIPEVNGLRDGEAPRAEADSILGVYRRWKVETRKSPARHHKVGIYVRRFTELFGDLKVQDITKKQVKEFSIKLASVVDSTRVSPAVRKSELGKLIAVAESRPDLPRLSQGTINKHIEGIATVLAFAEDCDLIASNPARKVKAPETAPPAVEVQPFRPAELRSILEQVAAVWPSGGDRKQRDRHWIVQVAIWNGARLEEIAQLRRKDVQMERGIWVLDINREDGKRVKNGSSVRRVPLHPHLVETGFIDHLETSCDGPTSPVFGTLKPTRRGDRGHEISRTFGVLKKKAGFTGREKDFHSFRHSFKDACREAGVPVDVQEALMGHASGNRVAASYGAGHSLATLAEHLKRVDPLGGPNVDAAR